MDLNIHQHHSDLQEKWFKIITDHTSKNIYVWLWDVTNGIEDKEILKEWFMNSWYNQLMSFTSEDILWLKISISWKVYGIQEIIRYFLSEKIITKVYFATSPRGFQDFITELFDKPKINDLMRNHLKDIWYDNLMWFSKKEFNEFFIEIWSQKFSVRFIVSRLGKEVNKTKPQTENFKLTKYDSKSLEGFQDFITDLFDKPKIGDVLRGNLKEIWYEKLLQYTASDIKSFQITIWKANFWVRLIATRLWYTGKENVWTPIWFRKLVEHVFSDSVSKS